MKPMEFHESAGYFYASFFSVSLPKDHSSKSILMGMPLLPIPILCLSLCNYDVLQAAEDGDRWLLKKDR